VEDDDGDEDDGEDESEGDGHAPSEGEMDSWSWMVRELEIWSRRSLRAQALERLPAGQLLHSLAAPPCLPPHWWQSQGRSTSQESVGRVSQHITALVMVSLWHLWPSC
jgi:hypothetical protein